ncbi:UDP-glucose 6-dehydrogenase [Sulfidibacter corallicola]|uniref:UDP-glucose 6-dehydrogenase n=1 Tax=Sulfidibacter corallicola TaxID=2818388 RepID=A0A8A4TWC5_SULCO|nr:nucleotide sugar dehydrogenase [Sulfidibacter corallicola]QTD53478.1 UDP-glucose/GDP-mannose dehydrogenase family protein [Sulfidibacter corallicola]
MTAPKVGFAGMTHLGLNSAVASAARGAHVTCYDGDEALVESLAAGRTHIVEPDLDRLLGEHAAGLQFTSDLATLSDRDFVYIAPDVPTNDRGESDLTGIRELIERVDGSLPAEIPLIVLSQVPPGFTRQLKLRAGRPLYYQVETLIFGQAIHRALHPERFIIGCGDPEEPLPEAFRTYLELFECPLLPMRYESAELAKISINCCLVASIGVANTLAELCERTGADWSEIVPALKRDKRIGPHAYLAPGLGIAGGNLERDLNTVIGLADRHGTDAGIVRAWIHNSEYRKHWVLRALHRRLLGQVEDPVIAVWGLAYKPNTHSTKNSPALALIDHLDRYRVQAFDPVVKGAPVEALGIVEAPDPREACAGADVLAIMTPWNDFKQVPPADVARVMNGTLVIDPYRTWNPAACREAGLTYITLGSA